MAALLVLNVFNMVTPRVNKLKKCAHLTLHDENYTSFVVSVPVHKMGWGQGALIREVGALIRGFTVIGHG